MTPENRPNREHHQQQEGIQITGQDIATMLTSPAVHEWLQTRMEQAHASYPSYELEEDIEEESSVVFLLDPETVTTEQPHVTALPMTGAELAYIHYTVEDRRDHRELVEYNYPLFTVVNSASEGEPVNPYLRQYVPSFEDLDNMNRTQHIGKTVTGYTGYPLYGKSMVEGEHVRLLLMQETPLARAQSYITRHDCAETLKTAESEGDIEAILRDYGYNSAVIQYQPGAENPLSDLDREALHKFAFTLQPTPEKLSKLSHEEESAWRQLEDFVAKETTVQTLADTATATRGIGKQVGIILDKRDPTKSGVFHGEDLSGESLFAIKKDKYGHTILTTYVNHEDTFRIQYQVFFPARLYLPTSFEGEAEVTDPRFTTVIEIGEAVLQDVEPLEGSGNPTLRVYEYNPLESPNDQQVQQNYLRSMKDALRQLIIFHASEKEENE